MSFKSDIEIAQEAKMQDIREIAKKLGIYRRRYRPLRKIQGQGGL